MKRRSFLSLISRSAGAVALLPSLRSVDASCWLDVCAPLIIQDRSLGIASEIVLTADNFSGARGYADGEDITEYEIYLYDSDGRPFGADGIARQLTARAMQTTVIPVSELVGPNTSFWGGMR